MWIARLIPLSLALVLIPEPGASQVGPQLKKCKVCQTPQSYEDPAWFQKVVNKGVNDYMRCSYFGTIRLELIKGVICVKDSVPWVIELINCLNGDKKCLTDGSSSSHKEYSKGTNEKPSTTTITVPTTAPATSPEPSTQRRDEKIGQSTEPAKHGVTTPATRTDAPNDVDTTPQKGSNKENINLPQGNDKLSENPNEEVDGKMKHMKTAIISLVVIVLVLVAVAVGLYCRRKTSKLNVPCGNGSVKYMSTPELDSVDI